MVSWSPSLAKLVKLVCFDGFRRIVGTFQLVRLGTSWPASLITNLKCLILQQMLWNTAFPLRKAFTTVLTLIFLNNIFELITLKHIFRLSSFFIFRFSSSIYSHFLCINLQEKIWISKVWQITLREYENWAICSHNRIELPNIFFHIDLSQFLDVLFDLIQAKTRLWGIELQSLQWHTLYKVPRSSIKLFLFTVFEIHFVNW